MFSFFQGSDHRHRPVIRRGQGVGLQYINIQNIIILLFFIINSITFNALSTHFKSYQDGA